ncbi:MAG: DinB family protein [Candidatus Eiseniibacteriota bacterium]
MSSEIDRILDQLQRAYTAQAWHGPAVLEVLAGVDATAARRRPIRSAHTILELVFHMTAWKDIVRRRLEGEKFDVTPAMDWPVPDEGDGVWERALAGLERAHLRLRDGVARFDPEKLDQAPASGSTAYVLMHGIIQHDLYHAGQIALLKKPAS